MITIDKTKTSKLQDYMDGLASYMKSTEEYKKLVKQGSTALFLSIGYKGSRADVFMSDKKSYKHAWSHLYKQAERYVRQKDKEHKIECIKIDWVSDTAEYSIPEFIQEMTNTKKNYFRKGISLGSSFEYAFLEQEINGNSFIKIDKHNNRGYLDEANIQAYIQKHRPSLKEIDFKLVDKIIVFSTKGFFFDGKAGYRLWDDELNNGRRKTELDAAELKRLISGGQKYLTELSGDDGRFTYGYFSCFDKEIKFYNMLRHASTIYSMIESYELFAGEELAAAIKRGLAYLVEKKLYIDGDTAYLIDGVQEDKLEIKLGGNAAAILAMTKYAEVFDDFSYLPHAQKLAQGILNLQLENGEFMHVLHYPSLQVKERFRIIYYDGEAAFALMRLYRLDKQQKWIDAVEKAFDHFIEKDYWKNHDHWLSYCTNELTAYKPERRYFEFGLKNVSDKLDFIYHRNTTFPTFLELTLATSKMIDRLKETGHSDLLDSFDEEKLENTIHKRAEYQRNGHFYPELAMYYKNPGRILGSFFIRHHSFRARIDDIEHYLSGYCAYYQRYAGAKQS